jgi:hypothetical protein
MQSIFTGFLGNVARTEGNICHPTPHHHTNGEASHDPESKSRPSFFWFLNLLQDLFLYYEGHVSSAESCVVPGHSRYPHYFFLRELNVPPNHVGLRGALEESGI